MFGIFDQLDNILPSTDTSKKHDTLQLGYLSACKLMENGNDILSILPHLPAPMFETLLESAIYKCYLEFINIEDGITIPPDDHDIFESAYFKFFTKKHVTFPETLRLLILNWPHKELVLRTKIPPLYPPVHIFQLQTGGFAREPHHICQMEDMIMVFDIFCNRLIHFILQGFFKCTGPSNIGGFSCKLRQLDVSGFGDLGNHADFFDDILEKIRNSTTDTFGHKIEIIVDIIPNIGKDGFKLKNFIEESCNPNLGLSVCFNTVYADFEDIPLPSDFSNMLALGKCKYIKLWNCSIDGSFAKQIGHHPEVIGLSLPEIMNIESMEFLRGFENLEQFSWNFDTFVRFNNITISISNMSKGLKYLNLSYCFLHSNDLECLANSKHADTLLELNISINEFTETTDDVGLLMLCQKLKKVKVLNVECCLLDILSPHSVTKLVNAFNDCVQLECLIMAKNPFSEEKTKIIVDGLAKNKLLRYLSLDLPEGQVNSKSCKTYHETINKSRLSLIYISWVLENE